MKLIMQTITLPEERTTYSNTILLYADLFRKLLPYRYPPKLRTWTFNESRSSQGSVPVRTPFLLNIDFLLQ